MSRVTRQISIKPGPEWGGDCAQQNGARRQDAQRPSHDRRTFVRGGAFNVGSRVPIGMPRSWRLLPRTAESPKKDVPNLPGHVERGQESAENPEIERPARRLPIHGAV